MRMYYSEGGQRNPDFRFKVKIKQPVSQAMAWCDEYPVHGEGYFGRYYIEWFKGDSNYVTFQFEQEEPAIMFTLKFAK